MESTLFPPCPLLPALGTLALFAIGLTTFLAALGGIDKYFNGGFADVMDRAVDIMTKLGQAIGGLVVGYLVAIPMGKIDFSALSQASLLSVPVPFKLGFSFHADAIIAMIFVYMVSTVETIGDTTAITNSGIGREATEKEIVGAVLADSVGSVTGQQYF